MSRFYFAVVFLMASSAYADKSAIAVLDIQGAGIDASLLPTLTEVLTVEIDNLGMYKVIGGRDVQAMLGFEREKDIVGCTDAACLAEIGGALGVDRIVVSQIGEVGKTFVVNIKLINIRMADTEGRAYETVRGEVDALIDTIRRSVIKLLGPDSKAAEQLGVKPRAVAKAPPPTLKQETASLPKTRPTIPEKQVTSPATEEPVAVSAESEGAGIGWLPIALWAGGGVSVGVGMLMGMAAKSKEKEANADENEDKIYDPGSQIAAVDARKLATGSTLFWVAGTALVGGGFLAWLLSDDNAEATTAFVPLLTPNGAGLSFSGSF